MRSTIQVVHSLDVTRYFGCRYGAFSRAFVHVFAHPDVFLQGRGSGAMATLFDYALVEGNSSQGGRLDWDFSLGGSLG